VAVAVATVRQEIVEEAAAAAAASPFQTSAQVAQAILLPRYHRKVTMGEVAMAGIGQQAAGVAELELLDNQPLIGVGQAAEDPVHLAV
jgi:hypothetical protein